MDVVIEAIKYFVLGLIQGVAEVLPISSSGHVVIAKALFNLEEDNTLLFLILINSGSFVTLFIVYAKKIWEIICGFFSYIFKKETREKNIYAFRFAWFIVIASIPAGIIGIFFQDQIDYLTTVYSTLLAGVGLLLTGTVLVLISRDHFKQGKTHLILMDAVLIGLAQGVALLPGVSRSGMTSSTGLARGIGVDSALDFSFLLYIPASLGSILLLLYKVAKNGMSIADPHVYLYYSLSFIAAMGATYVAYRLIFNIFRTGKIKYFGYYCLVVGMFSVILYVMGA